MRRIGILGDIGSGKSYIANSFGYPVFNADEEVAKVYKKDKKVFIKLKKRFKCTRIYYFIWQCFIFKKCINLHKKQNLY